jgi:hypothetical protein
VNTALFEGLLGDLTKAGVTQFQAWLTKSKGKIRKNPELEKAIQDAKKLEMSLLDTEDKAVQLWWKNLFNMLGVPGKARKKLQISVLKEIEPKIDRSGEDFESHLEKSSSNRSRSDVAQRLRSRRNRRDLEAEIESISRGPLTEDFRDILSNLIDMTNPRTKAIATANLIRQSNNMRIAALAVDNLMKSGYSKPKDKTYEDLVKQAKQGQKKPKPEQALQPEIQPEEPEGDVPNLVRMGKFGRPPKTGSEDAKEEVLDLRKMYKIAKDEAERKGTWSADMDAALQQQIVDFAKSRGFKYAPTATPPSGRANLVQSRTTYGPTDGTSGVKKPKPIRWKRPGKPTSNKG